MQSVVRHATQITITPAYCNESAYTTTALILRSLTKYLPNRIDTAYNWKHVPGLEFANRDSMNSDSIDIIIGADLFGMLVLETVFEKVPNMSLPRKILFSAGFFLDQ